jgi:hypothetical protein
MAIQGQVILSNGIDMTSAYLIVSNMDFNTTPNDTVSVNIHVLIYKDKECKDAGKSEVVEFFHKCSGSTFVTYFDDSIFEVGGTNPRKQAYIYLKTLPTYSNFIDV